MKLIVGLGNPGREYEGTRHNAGFKAADYIAGYFGMDPFKMSDKHKAEITEGQIAGEKVILAKPKTFMNLSGQAVQSLSNFYKIPPQDIIVIHDDVDLHFGTLRIRPNGSAGGHNGIKSIIEHIGEDFTRIRIGIQPAEPFPGALEDYVLGKLTGEQFRALKMAIDKTPSTLETLIKEDAEEVMQRFN